MARHQADWDWLGYAIEKLGGPSKAAGQIGVSRQTIYVWLETGLAVSPFGKVVRIAQLADVPLEYLSRRMGPPEDIALALSETPASR